MTIDELSSSAWRGSVPDGMSLPERAFWYPLRDLYAATRRGELSTEQAKADKAALVRVYERDVSRLRDEEQARMWNAQLWQRIEQAGIRFAKEQTVEAALAFYEAVYRMRPRAKDDD